MDRRQFNLSLALSAAVAATGCAPALSGANIATSAASASPASANNGRDNVQIDPARIEAALKPFADNGKVAGLSAMVYHQGREVFFGAYGKADIGANTDFKRDTLIQIFSMTKAISGTALMRCYERGLFDLDAPLEAYLPEYAASKVYRGDDANGQPILTPPSRKPTVRDITRHTAGLAPGYGMSPYVTAEWTRIDPMAITNTLEEMSHKLATVPLIDDPEGQWAYGPSVDVQARLVEVLTGEKFGDYVQHNILDPLGMTQTRYRVPDSDRHRLARIYDRSGENTLTPRDDEASFHFNIHDWPMQPGGWGFTATIDDYMKFAQMLQNEGAYAGGRILLAETVRLMATNQLSEDVQPRSWLPSKGQVGFGIDFAVRIRPPANAQEASGALGEFFWDGAASPMYFIDPANDVTGVLFAQFFPFDQIGLHKAFRDAIYYGSAAAAPSA